MGVDFNGSKPVKTVRDDEFKIKLVDGASGTTAAKILSVVGEGDAFVAASNDFGIPCIVKDSTGDAKILTLDAAGGLPVTVSNSSIAVTATDLDIRDLAFATDSVDVSGSSVSISGSVAVTATDLDIRNLAFATDTVDVSGSSVSISGSVAVTATDLDIRNLAFATDTVDVSGSAVSITGSVAVTATDLDVRDLAFATDKVDVSGSSVSVTGTVAVSSTDLDIRDLSHSQDSVKVGDGTDFLAVTTAGEASVRVTAAQAVEGATAPAEVVQVGGKDSAGNIRAVRTLPDGTVVVQVDASAGNDPVYDFQTSATVGVNSTVNHDYVITSGKLFKGSTVLVSGRGALKATIGIFDGTTFVPKAVWFSDPKESIDRNISKLELLGDGTKAIRILVQNLDGNSSDVYSTLSGEEI